MKCIHYNTKEIIIIGGNVIESITQKYKIHEADDDAKSGLLTIAYRRSRYLLLWMARSILITRRQFLRLCDGMGFRQKNDQEDH